MTGWIHDAFLLGWSALYWNARKTWHALRGRRHRCPCHVASDSGRAYETGCEAVTHLRSPARFRAVCPLLSRRADGAWVCSVDSSQVRPFWGRAALLFGGGGLVSYLTLTLLALGLLSALGYHATYRQVAWPPAWRELRVVQAHRYLEKAREARAAGRHEEALLALSNAYELNPADFGAGLLLAQLWQSSQPLLSNATFGRLYRDHPEHREQTAQLWYRGLLARGEFAAVIPLARDRMLAAGATAPSPAWIQAYLFATRRIPGFADDPQLLAAPGLAPSIRALLRLEHTLPTQKPDQRVQALSAAVAAEKEPFAINHLLRRLLEEKRPDLVLSTLARPGLPLGEREKVRLRLDALADLGRGAERANIVRQILALPPHPALWELLSSHLIARPDRELIRLVAEDNRREPLPANDTGYPQMLAWFAACGANGDKDLMAEAAKLLADAAARDHRALDIVRKAFLETPTGFRIENVLPFLQPFPLEPAYALYDRYAPPPPFPD